MKLLKVSALVAFACHMVGCTTTDHVYSADGKCLTCFNNPITGKALNYEEGQLQENADKTTTPTSNASTSGKKVNEFTIEPFTVPVNVDIAYIKIKNEFGYFTEQEIRQEWGKLASTKLKTFSFAYDATPSVYYRMRKTVKIADYNVIVDTKIEKSSDTKSDIKITYWPIDKPYDAHTKEIATLIQTRVLNALK